MADYQVTNAGTSGANQTYTENGTYNGKAAYQGDSDNSWWIRWSNCDKVDRWVVEQSTGKLCEYLGGSSGSTPNEGSYSPWNGTSPAATVAAAGDNSSSSSSSSSSESSSSQTQSPGTVVSTGDSPFSGSAWSNPNNAKVSDGNYATAGSFCMDQSQGLKATNFGFSIPAGATIDGIEVKVERKCNVGGVKDQYVRIVKGGSIGSTDKAVATAWPTSDTVRTYGSPTDLWGESWSVADINGSGLGAALSAMDNSGCMDFDSAYVDHIEITVYYTGGSDNSSSSSSQGFSSS